MADLTDSQAAQTVKVALSDSSGSESSFVTDSTPFPTSKVAAGDMVTNGATAATKSSLVAGKYTTLQIPVKVGADGAVYTRNEVTSEIPAFSSNHRMLMAAGTTNYFSHTMTQDIAFKEMHVGGRVACEGFISRYVAATESVLNGFDSTGEVATWSNTGIGDSSVGSWSYATDQFVVGTGSAKYTFTKSGAADYPEISYTFPTAQDFSEWRYISAYVRVTVAAGGSTSRTVQIRLTSGTAVRIYSITGTTTTAPFSTEQWQLIQGEIETPTSTSGTGTFDVNSVNSIALRLTDGANKTGSIWWDNVKLLGSMDILEKIYSSSGETRQLIFDPVVEFDNGQVLLMSMKNNSSTTAGEISITTSGVAL